VISRRGLIYTVEEVSDLLGIPRPTLYRYLREYSIPHLRRSGKISIPEESFDRIREARDLHKEGLGTESVRRALREGGPDTGEIKERIERLSESLESLRVNGSAADEALSSRAMRTVLARQSLMLSALFNLTEMVEELLLASGKPRKSVFEEVESEIREVTPLPDRAEARVGPVLPAPRGLPASAALPARSERFGSLARRRRRAFLVLLSALVMVAVLLLALPAIGGVRVGETQPASPSEEPKTQAAENAAPPGTTSGELAAARTPSADEVKRPDGERSRTSRTAAWSGPRGLSRVPATKSAP
jgi:excisionase family DNA binding protein